MRAAESPRRTSLRMGCVYCFPATQMAGRERPTHALLSQLVDDLWNNLIYGCIGETIDAVRVAAPPGRRSSH